MKVKAREIIQEMMSVIETEVGVEKKQITDYSAQLSGILTTS